MHFIVRRGVLRKSELLWKVTQNVELLQDEFCHLEGKPSIEIKLYFFVLTEGLDETDNLRFLTIGPIVDPFFEQFFKNPPKSRLCIIS